MADFSSFFEKSSKKEPQKAKRKGSASQETDKEANELRLETARVWAALLRNEKTKKTKKTKTNDEKAVSKVEETETEPVYEPNKVVLKLSKDLNELELKNFLEQNCGVTVKNVLLLKKKLPQKPQTTAFVEFPNNEMCKKLLSFNGRVLKDHRMEVNLVRRKFATVLPGNDTIFIKNLDYKVSEEILRKVFGGCGVIKSVNLPVFEDSKKPKGFGFITFSDWQSTAKAVKMNRTNICGREILIEVSKAKMNENNETVGKRKRENDEPKHKPKETLKKRKRNLKFTKE